MDPKPTTLKQDTQKLGGYAAEKLISLIEHPKTSVPGNPLWWKAKFTKADQ